MSDEDLTEVQLQGLERFAKSEYSPGSYRQKFAENVTIAVREIRRARATAGQDCIEPRRPFRPDKLRVDRCDWVRASGLAVCATCELPYADHASVRGYEWLTRLCDGRLVKL